MTSERYSCYAFRSTRSSWLTLGRERADPSRRRSSGHIRHCRGSIGYEFLYWHVAPVLASPARYALRTLRTGA